MPKSTQTQDLIKVGFYELLKSHTFEKITVKLICEKASINRITFYNYYADKYDLLNSIILDIINNIFEKAKTYVHTNTTDDSLTQYICGLTSCIIDVCFESRDIILSFTDQENSMLVYMIQSYAHDEVYRLLLEINHLKKLKYDPKYIASFIVGGYSNLIFEWIKTNDSLSNKSYNKIINELSLDLVRLLTTE